MKDLKSYSNVLLALKLSDNFVLNNKDVHPIVLKDIVPVHCGIDFLSKEGCYLATNKKPEDERIYNIFKANDTVNMILINPKDNIIYLADIIDYTINIKPIKSPDPSITPAYYQNTRCKAWYKLNNFRLCNDTTLIDNLVLSFLKSSDGSPITLRQSLAEKRNTFWYLKSATEVN